MLENPAYVAVALSTDSSMGDDSVMECIPENGNIKAYTSWTSPGPNYGATRDGVVSNYYCSCNSYRRRRYNYLHIEIKCSHKTSFDWLRDLTPTE